MTSFGIHRVIHNWEVSVAPSVEQLHVRQTSASHIWFITSPKGRVSGNDPHPD